MRLQESRDNKTFSSLGFVFNPDLLFSGVLLATGFALWVFVLSRWDVSVAYPFLSLNLIVVMLCSKFIFSENIKRHQWIGACFIFGGVLLISGGDLI